MDPVVEAVDILFRVKFVMVTSEKFSADFHSKFNCSFADITQLFPEIRGIQDCIRDPSSNTAFQVNRIKLSITDNQVIENRSSNFDLKSHLLKVVTNEVDVQRLISENIDDLSTPWYESWKKSFLKSFPDTTSGQPSHEFVGCYFGAIYVLSVEELINFKDVLVELQSKISSSIKWFFSNYIKYFIIVGSTSNTVSNCPQFNELVLMYGSNACCALDLDENGVQVTYINGGGHNSSTHGQNVITTTESASKFHKNEVTLDPLSLGRQDSDVTYAETNETLSIKPQIMQTKTGVIEEKNISIDSSTSSLIDSLLRKLIIETLIPFAEKQMKLLEDIIKKRKNQGSIFNISKGLSTLANLRSNAGRIDAIYNLTSDEMVTRKCGDLCLSLGLLELALKYYNDARRDFQGDGAHLFTAGACEMVGIVAHLLPKNNSSSASSSDSSYASLAKASKGSLHYLDQGINLYLDTCKVDHLATRATILASLVIISSMETNLNSSNSSSSAASDVSAYQKALSSMFIRLTSEDNDLHSGLFLEQAAKYFQLNGKRRKCSFHFVLCGHRYNKCNLSSLALISYRRYVCKDWFYSVEHVQYTLSKLYLKSKYNYLRNGNSEHEDNDLMNQLKIRGIDTLRRNCDKELFFQDFKIEAPKYRHLMVTKSPDSDLVNNFPVHNLDIPFIKSIKKEEIEGSFSSKDGRVSCFIQEPFSVFVTLWTPFAVEAKNVTIIPAGGQESSIKVSSHDLVITSDEVTIKFRIEPQMEGNFELFGLQFVVGNEICCRKVFNQKFASKLKFMCIKSLPPLDLILSRTVSNETLNDVQTIESLSGEVVPINVVVSNCIKDGWSPTGIKLSTSTGQSLAVHLEQMVTLDIESPTEPGSHLIQIKIEYFEGMKSRTRTRSIELFVREVLLVENLIHGVISLRNILTSGQSLSVMGCDISPGLTAHLLINDVLSIDWAIGTRKGKLNINESAVNDNF